MRIAPKIACVFHDLAKREMKLGAVILGVGNLLCGWFKNQLREMVETLFPMLEVVRMFVHVPDVRHAFLFQVSMNVLADANQTVFVSARNVEKF